MSLFGILAEIPRIKYNENYIDRKVASFLTSPHMVKDLSFFRRIADLLRIRYFGLEIVVHFSNVFPRSMEKLWNTGITLPIKVVE